MKDKAFAEDMMRLEMMASWAQANAFYVNGMITAEDYRLMVQWIIKIFKDGIEECSTDILQ